MNQKILFTFDVFAFALLRLKISTTFLRAMIVFLVLNYIDNTIFLALNKFSMIS